MSEPKRRRRTWRLGAREQKRVQITLIVIICGLLAFVLYQPFMDFIERRDFQVCQSNVFYIARAVKTYTQDWDDALPLAASWMDAVESNMAATSGTGKNVGSYFRCPLDKGTQPSSYEYNSALEGVSLTVRASDAQAEARRKRFGRIDRAALIVEHHGSARNASVDMVNWDAVIKNLELPHHVSGESGWLVQGDLNPSSWNRERLTLVVGKRF